MLAGMPSVLVRAVVAVPFVLLATTVPALPALPAGPAGPRPSETATTLPASTVRGAHPADVEPAGSYRPPVPGEVVHPFDPPVEVWSAGHRGVDLAARSGDPVTAPGPGLVTFAGQVGGKPVVVVTHTDGLRSTLEPVVATADVGTTVAAGELLGTLTSAPATADNPGHCSPDDCVHWGVRRGDAYVDPLTLLGAAPPIVLLPLG